MGICQAPRWKSHEMPDVKTDLHSGPASEKVWLGTAVVSVNVEKLMWGHTRSMVPCDKAIGHPVKAMTFCSGQHARLNIAFCIKNLKTVYKKSQLHCT